MAMTETRHTTGPGKGVDGDELSGLLAAISNILDEMADAEADAAYHIPCAPCGPLEEGLAVLFYRLRRSLIIDDNSCLPGEALTARLSFDGNGNRIDSDRRSLDTALDDILELALSPGRPSITWAELEVRFRHFASRVTEHAVISDGMRRKSVSPRATTPK